MFQVHPWFKGIDWDRIYHMDAAFIPEVKDELDTQNFEKFEEVFITLFMFILFLYPTLYLTFFFNISV